jgi:hypothetical protein
MAAEQRRLTSRIGRKQQQTIARAEASGRVADKPTTIDVGRDTGVEPSPVEAIRRQGWKSLGQSQQHLAQTDSLSIQFEARLGDLGAAARDAEEFNADDHSRQKHQGDTIKRPFAF